jgi:hypothetical protein
MVNRVITLVVALPVMLLVPTAGAQQAVLSNALFLVTNNTPYSELAIFPVDSISLQDMTSYAPLPMGSLSGSVQPRSDNPCLYRMAQQHG